MKTLVTALIIVLSLTVVTALVSAWQSSKLNVSNTNIILLQPLSSRGTKTIFITPNNIRYYAKYLDNSVTIDDRVIRVTSGSASEALITVPLADTDELDPETIVRVTVGFDSDLVTTDNDVRVGISDGSYYNQFYITDTATSRVCYPYGGSHEGNTASEGTSYYPGQVTMIFQPFYKYGSCYTGHDGGHVNVGIFSNTVDPTSGLNLQVNRGSSAEQYRIYYFMIEFL